MSQVACLRACPPGAVRSLLATLRAESFEEQAVVLQPNMANDKLYFLLRGSADEMNGELVSRSITSFNCFGEKFVFCLVCASFS